MQVIRTRAKKAFVPTKIPGAEYVLNPYVGCGHACLYCYVQSIRWYREYREMGTWGSWVVVKENFPELVKRERVKGRVYMGSMGDVYQPVERELQITRRTLENMDRGTEISILTKSDLVLRDFDVISGFPRAEVGLTINGFEKEVKRVLEPFAPGHERRVRALEELRDAGIKTYAMISPVIPELVDVAGVIRETKEFVGSYWIELLNLRAAGKRFRAWLREEYPDSYSFFTDLQRVRKYVEELKREIKDLEVEVRGIAVHHRGMEVVPPR